MVYAIGTPVLLLGILAQKKWGDLPGLIIPILLTFYLWSAFRKKPPDNEQL